MKPIRRTLSIKNVPDDWVERLRERASRNHRSLQGELMAILERLVGPSPHRSSDELVSRIRDMGLSTPAEAADFVRGERDAR